MEKVVYFLVSLAIVGINALNTTLAPTTSTNATTPTPIVTIPTSASPKTTASHNTTISPSTTQSPVIPAKLPNDNGTKATMLKFHFTNPNTQKVCILAEMAMKFVFSYNMTEGNKTKMEGIEWNMRNGTTVSTNKSVCTNETQQLVLLMPFGNDIWELTLYFNKTTKGDKYQMNATKLVFLVNNITFPNVIEANKSVDATTQSGKIVFTWSSKTALKCTSDEVINGFNKTGKASLHQIDTSSVKLQSFGTTNGTDFLKDLTYCPADTRVSNIVPIAVGAALAGLVLIVLIAYLIGRSRNNRGYESV